MGYFRCRFWYTCHATKVRLGRAMAQAGSACPPLALPGGNSPFAQYQTVVPSLQHAAEDLWPLNLCSGASSTNCFGGGSKGSHSKPKAFHPCITLRVSLDECKDPLSETALSTLVAMTTGQSNCGQPLLGCRPICGTVLTTSSVVTLTSFQLGIVVLQDRCAVIGECIP